MGKSVTQSHQPSTFPRDTIFPRDRGTCVPHPPGEHEDGHCGAEPSPSARRGLICQGLVPWAESVGTLGVRVTCSCPPGHGGTQALVWPQDSLSRPSTRSGACLGLGSLVGRWSTNRGLRCAPWLGLRSLRICGRRAAHLGFAPRHKGSGCLQALVCVQEAGGRDSQVAARQAWFCPRFTHQQELVQCRRLPAAMTWPGGGPGGGLSCSTFLAAGN